MYEAYFGLREKPFSITPNPGYLFLGRRHREALGHLVYGVRERIGFVQLTGEVGTGKTLLARALLEQLPPNVDAAFVYRPTGTVADFVATILQELGIGLPQRRYSLKELVDRLNQHLLEAHSEGRTTLLLIDEAQNLRPDLVEQVRLLTNLETQREKLLQIILVGQPELRRLLARPDLRQVAQRITARYHLDPLDHRETAAYVEHRLRVAGAGRSLFSRAALWWLHRRTRGVPRLINIVADRALLGAYARGANRVTGRHVCAAAGEVDGTRAWKALPVAAAAALAGIALSTLLWYPAWRSAPADASTLARSERPSDQLGNRLLMSDYQTSLDRAFTGLFALWNARRSDSSVAPCRAARQAGLRCHYGEGGLDTLRRLNRPAIVELLDTSGEVHRAVIASLDDEAVTLRLGGDEMRVSIARFIRHWTGDFLILWDPLELTPTPARPGDRGGAVVWLRSQLAGVDEQTASEPELFDDALARRLRRFQAESGLPATGTLDETTLLYLQSAGDRRGPLLVGRHG